MTGNTGHHLSITSKLSTLKEKRIVLSPCQQLKGHEESQTNKYVTAMKAQQQQHEVIAGVQPVQ